MSVQDIRLNIHQLLEETSDKDLLKTYLNLLQTLVKFKSQQVIGYDMDGNPITASSISSQADEAVKRVKAGNFIRHEDLMKEVENW